MIMRDLSSPVRRGARGAAVLALVVGAVGCSSAESKAPRGDSTGAGPTLALGPQDLATATLVAGGSPITLSGPLNPKDVVTLRAQVGGTVAELRVNRGTAVRRGQVLATIRAAGVQSQAAGARAAVAAADANLAVARQRLDAANTLRQAGAMSALDHRAAQAAFEAAQAQLAAAHAQAASAGEAAGYTTIVAPIDGVVSNRRAQEGEAVNPGGELLTIVDGRVLELAGQIGVADAARVRVGQAVTFALDAYPSEDFHGRVARIDPVADAGTRQVGVYVELANGAGRIIGGTYGRGSIATAAAAAPRLVIPAAALRTSGADTSVLVVQAGRLAARPVTLGPRDEAAGTVVVLSGLAAGDRVIAVPSVQAKPGAPVTIAGAPASASREE